ncbi:glycosyltransferase [bacterium]|nr:glycosyltransferase [bacterium]
MYEPEVTIITPTSNIVEADLADDFSLLINLLDRQTYPYLDHLVIDNASTDGTIEILKEYKNSGFINFYSEPDRGKFDAMNKGIMRTKSKYVAFLSCDDFYHDITAIYDIVNTMEEENADFCFFPSYCVSHEGFVFQFVPAILNTFQLAPCSRQAMFFKRSVLEQLNYFDDKFKMLADYDLMIRLLLNNFKGIYFDRNILTYKLGLQVAKHQVQSEAEFSHIFYKNYKNLYPMSDEVLSRMVKISEMPKPLLDKLALKFPAEDRQLFFERYKSAYNMRVEALNNQRAQGRMDR